LETSIYVGSFRFVWEACGGSLKVFEAEKSLLQLWMPWNFYVASFFKKKFGHL